MSIATQLDDYCRSRRKRAKKQILVVDCQVVQATLVAPSTFFPYTATAFRSQT
jgi:hypothetical protein